MAKKKSNRAKKTRKAPPKVRIAQPNGRPYQLRYTCPIEGREVRISTGTRDLAEAEHQKLQLEAKLLLGLPGQKPVRKTGPTLPWQEFREEYTTLHLATIREKSAIDTESRLDVTGRILRPRTLADVADPQALHQLQTKLLAGVESQRGRPRSVFTVKGYMGAVLAAMRWAHLQGWLESPPVIRKIKVGKLKAMKGRPITTAEFNRMLDATEAVVGPVATPSWQYLLRGLWASVLRIDELMHVSWDIDGTIRPMQRKDRLPVLAIPAALQKNDTEESIPLLPWFEVVLMETPAEDRTGWAFNPASTLKDRAARKPRNGRLKTVWVSKVVVKIGQKADVTVDPGDQRTGRPTKYASAHDLRRSCAERMLDAGVPPLAIARILRHVSWETTRRHYAPGNVQKDAELLRMYLGTDQEGT